MLWHILSTVPTFKYTIQTWGHPVLSNLSEPSLLFILTPLLPLIHHLPLFLTLSFRPSLGPVNAGNQTLPLPKKARSCCDRILKLPWKVHLHANHWHQDFPAVGLRSLGSREGINTTRLEIIGVLGHPRVQV